MVTETNKRQPRDGVLRRGDRWYIRYDGPTSPEGTRRQRVEATDAKTRVEARALRAKRMSEVLRGDFIEPSSLTVASYFESWLTSYAVTHVRPRTLEGYRGIVRRYIVPALGTTPIQKVTPAHIQSLYSVLLTQPRAPRKGSKAEPKVLTARTVLSVHRVFVEALKHAVKWGVLVRNPALAVDAPRPLRSVVTVLNYDDARRLLSVAHETPIGPLVGLALFTGLRRGELLGLQWQNCDLAAGALSVRQTRQRIVGQGVTVQPPKSDRGSRRVALGPEAVDLLRAHRAHQLAERLRLGPAWHEGDWVFTNPDGLPMSPDTLTHEFSKVAKAAGLKMRLHDTRHAHATFLLAAGTHPRIVQERLGHADVSTTLNIYSSVLPGLQEAAARALEVALRGGHAEAM